MSLYSSWIYFITVLNMKTLWSGWSRS